MNLLPVSSLSRRFMMLAPRGTNLRQFVDVAANAKLYDQMLANVQRFRGHVYLAEDTLTPAELTPDGRHVQSADHKSWHLLTISESGAVSACGRLLLHDEDAGFSDLTVSQSILARSKNWGPILKEGVEAELQSARRRNLLFGELGAWAIAPELRCTTEAVRMVLAGYALSQFVGGASGISTVNSQTSAPILRRIGGQPLFSGDRRLPSFYEPKYRAELEILRFDSSEPNPRYSTHIDACRSVLHRVMVISPDPVTSSWKSPLPQLQPLTDTLAHGHTM